MFKSVTVARLSFGLLALVLGSAACGTSASAAGGLEANGAWARTSPMNAEAGAAYLTITSEEAVSIVSASVSSDVAGRVELHETVPVSESGDAMDDDADDEGMEGMEDDTDADEEGMEGEMAMTMQPVSVLEIAPGGEAVLEPGGKHLMMFELAKPLEVGQTFDLTLLTEDGVELVVPVEVRDEAP